MNAVISLLAGLAGTIVGAALAWLSSTRQQRIRDTFDLHREFHSPEMIDSRYQAAELLKEHKGKGLQEIRDDIGAASMHNFWNVLLFYQRLWLAVKYNGVQRRYIAGLFGEIFDWWYLQFFQYRLDPRNRELVSDIEHFHVWLISHASHSQVDKWRQGHVFDPIDAKGTLPEIR